MRFTGITIVLLVVLSTCNSLEKQSDAETPALAVQGENLTKLIAARKTASSATAHADHNGWQIFELERGYYGIHPEGLLVPVIFGSEANLLVTEFLCNDIKLGRGTLELIGGVSMYQESDQRIKASSFIMKETAEPQ